ncbi:hypothetical protein ABT121_32185 [Streptomyces sp. NPDC001928]|uniref:SbtR family transcriptional regulator n=1 Tax=Streptomyces sp. NPDC001928 TaxID=3154404 RepID=UPI0033205A2B
MPSEISRWDEDPQRLLARELGGRVPALRPAPCASGRIAAPSRERVTGTVATILEQGIADGMLRVDVDPDDVTTMLIGVFLAITSGAPQEQTDRLLDLLTDAVRPRASAGTDS